MDILIDNVSRVAGLARQAGNAAEAVAERGAFEQLTRQLLDTQTAMRPATQTIDKSSELYSQCLELESFLIKNLLNSMRATVNKSGFMDGGFAGEMYEDLLYDEYAKDFTKNASFGYADLAYLELTGQRGKVINQVF